MIRTLARGLSVQGISVDIATTNDRGEGGVDNQQLYRPVSENGATFRYFPRQTRFYTCSLPLAAWLWKHVADYDLVHIHALFSFPSTIAAVFAGIRRVPYIVRPLGILNAWGMKNRHPFFKEVSFRFCEKRLLRNAFAVQFTSEPERAEAESLGAVFNAVVIPNPVDTQVEARADRPFSTSPVYLFLSRIDEKKGLDLLLRAFAIVQAELPGSRLVIAGEGTAGLTGSLRALAEDLRIGHAVSWVGFVEGDSKRKVSAEADVFVLSSYSENFGVSVVEAMAAGLPVVITDCVGIHPEITRSRAGIVTPCNAEEFAQGMLQAVRDPEASRKMCLSGRLLARTEFSVPAVCRRLIDLYRSATLAPATLRPEGVSSRLSSPGTVDFK